MEHLSHKSRLTAVLLSLGMLMFFFFTAPAYAQSPNPSFKSTSPYRIANPAYSTKQADPSSFGHQTYRSTIYTPFGNGTPSSNNPSGNSGSGGSGDSDDDIGIPGWADTPSEPLPIGDTVPLFLFTAAMIAIIFIKQRRKQFQTTTHTSNNHSNNDTNEMTLTQHTRKSFRKLLMLALLLCVVGEASGQTKTDTTLNKKQNAAAAATKTIYFRPSTVCIDGGYTYTGGSGSNIAWVRYGSSNRRYFIVEKPSNSSTPTYHAFTKTLEILPNGTTAAKATKSRFLSATLSTTSSFSCYRVYNLTTDEDNAKKIDITQARSNSTISGKVQNCIPNNEWWLNNGAYGQTWTSKLISVADMGDKNLVAIQEGYWAGGDESSSTKKGYYFGYYLENDAHIYFENKNDWSAPTFLRGKDIYAYSQAMTKIDSTNLYYCKLAAPTSDVESGIAYTDYAFISKATTKGYDVNNEDELLWKRWPHATDNATDLAFSSKDNNSFDKLRKKSGYSYTGALSNKLSGTYNLFIPGSANDAIPTQVSLTDQKSLNQEHTFIVETGGKINMYVHALDYYTNIVSNSPRTDISGTRNEKVVYTSTVWLSAHAEDGYDFIGWFEKDNLGNLTRLSTSSQYHYEVERTNRTIVAKFADKKKFRMQIFENKSETSIYDKNDWTDSNQGGTLTFSYTKTDGTPYTETIDDANHHTKDDIHPKKTLTITATPKSGYIFVGFWNNLGYPVTTNPWNMTNPGSSDETVTARFAKIFQQKVYAYTYNAETDVFDAKGTSGGSVTIEYPRITNTNAGCEEARVTTTGEWSDNVLAEKTTMTITASAADGYEFLGWYSTAGEPIDWMNQEGAKVSYTANAAYTIVARFHKPFTQAFDVQTEIGGQYQNSTTGGSATITYNNTTTNLTDQLLTISNMEQGTMVTLNATPNDGYRFVGWYNGSGALDSSSPRYTYCAEDSKTVHARFAPSNITLSVAVLNYNPEYDKFEEYGYEYNTITLKENSTVLKESYSSFKQKFENATTVTLTATPEEGEDGYDFVGWYMNDEKLSVGTNDLYTLTEANPTELRLNLSGAVAVNAHFAPKKCWEVIIRNNIGGLFTVQYSRDANFTAYKTAESALDHYTYTYFAFGTTYVKVSPQPIHGYKLLGFKVGGVYSQPEKNNIVTYAPKYNEGESKKSQVMTNFVREDEQIVYLNLKGSDGNIPTEWTTNDLDQYAYYAFVDNSFYTAKNNLQLKWIKMTHVQDDCYTCTIPGNMYNRISFVQIGKDSEGYFVTKKKGDLTRDRVIIDFDTIQHLGLNYVRDTLKLENRRTSLTAIPSTRYNCYRIKGIYSSNTGNGQPGYVDGWVAPPTQEGDYRLIYIEQKVASKTKIDTTYIFEDGDRIKKVSSGNKTDIVSLHIYNKVSKDNNGNLTGTALNNPEIILQQWNESTKQWEDVEGQRYMVFGPLQTDDTDHVRMPGRKNTVQVVVDKGINAIKAEKDDATKDYGSGVWNFYITQENGNVKLELDKTEKYTGKYYIRTPNADGQYHNFTHPGNIMSYSEYAKNNHDYSHYFIRYVDINEDGTPTVEAGKHPVVKFCVANDYAINLSKEFTNVQNRFETEEDIYVLNAGDLPADASVRFGWDIRTNRLTRAYIANTTIKNNEYLVVEGTNIGSPSGDDTYFTDNSNWLYSIDLPDATAGATAKVKAKMNGQYQYFMGAEHGSPNEYETLISGNGANTYPIRLLYDFKDDRFTTIYRPDAALSGTVNLETPVMIEREHNDAPTQIQFNQGAEITVEDDNFDQPAYAVMTFLESVLADASKTHHEKMFYWISFPFDVCIRDVFGLGDYGKYWIMEEYNGAQRAKSGLAQNNWKYITKKSHILKKDTGYVLCLNYSQILQDQLFKSYGGSDKTLNSGRLSLYFPSNGVISPAAIKGGQERTVTLEQYEDANTAWNHHNWHIIGVPSFADPKFVDLQGDIPFVYQYWHPGDAYAAKAYTEITFHAMHAYMVQYHGKIKWQSIVNTSDGNVQPKALAAKTDEQADKNIMLRLELQQAGSTLDKTYVQLRNDKGTKGFDMSLDLTKIINAGANIYSIVDNHEMAGNAIPKEETVLPLGVVITAAGEYTISMPNGTEGIMVELIDYEQGTSTNLLMSDYTITLDKGTFNQRFALRLVPDKTATSVEDITGDSNDDNVRKLLIDGVLYLQQGNNTYDAQGHAIR